MKTLATYSIKGGVGKTTAAANLAATAAAEGARVLLWDLDPQGAVTYLFRVKPRVRGGGRALIQMRRPLVEAARATNVANLDLVPGDFRYRHLDLMLDGVRRPTRRLHELIEPLEDEYDWVVLDCAPSVSLVSEGVFEAAGLLLVPMVPSALSVRTLDQLLAFLEDLRGSAAGTVADVFTFCSMVDRRRRLHRDIVADLPAERPGMVAQTYIPYSSAVERMGVDRAPLPSGSPAARAFAALWDEVKARLPPD